MLKIILQIYAFKVVTKTPQTITQHTFSTEQSFEFDSPPEFERPVKYNLEATNLKRQWEGGEEGTNGGRKGGVGGDGEGKEEEMGREGGRKEKGIVSVWGKKRGGRW